MAFASVNGQTVSRLTLRLPISGAWELEAVVATDDVAMVTGSAVVMVGQVELRGTARGSGIDRGGRCTVRVVAGAAGLDTALEALQYDRPVVAKIVAGILAPAGERLDPDSDPIVLARAFDWWVRGRGDVAEALRRLAEAAATTWRYSLDGSIRLGPDTWSEVEPEHTVVEQAPTEGWDVIALDGLDVLPGRTFRGRRVSAVEYSLDSEKLRARVSYDATREGLAAEIARAIRRETAQIDYFASYDARVVGQNPDGSLELVPLTSRLPGLSRIPIRGLPGVTVKVAPGARVAVRFLNGSPALPYASDLEPQGLLEVTVAAAVKVRVEAPSVELGDGYAYALRSGDKIKIVGTVVPGPGTVDGVITLDPAVLAQPGPPPAGRSKVLA